LALEDRQRLERLRNSQLTIPIMILDSLLPKQKLTWQSTDPKFRRLIEYCLSDDNDDNNNNNSAENQHVLGMVGLNPHTGRPLCHGVTASVTNDTVRIIDNIDGKKNALIHMTVTGGERMQVQGEPWLDDSKCFYLANVEITEHRQEILSSQQKQDTLALSETLSTLMPEWYHWVIASHATDPAGFQLRMDDLGKMPDVSDLTDRALWVAAVINPLPALGVCLEIRPAMLSCQNDYDRMVLAVQAVQSSIDQMSGKRRLF